MNYNNITISHEQKLINRIKYLLAFFNENAMKKLLAEISRDYPEFEQQVEYEIQMSGGTLINTNFSNLSYQSLIYKANDYMRFLSNKISRYDGVIFADFSGRSKNILYESRRTFNAQDELYEKNGRKLTVSTLLSVVDYATKVIDCFYPNKNTEKVSQALLVFNGIDLLLNNKPTDKPTNKAMHYANDVMLEIAGMTFKSEEEKKEHARYSLALDLAIDFFVNE